MTVSIIIAVKIWQKNLEECITKCLELDFLDFEILVLPDGECSVSTKGICDMPILRHNSLDNDLQKPMIRIIPTGMINPAQKRDIAINYATGEILAFIDDDAYPAKDWLKNAVKNFLDPQVAAVGGPAITPEDDNIRQKASGLIYSSPLVSAKYVYRYLPKKRREVNDYPSCNFLMRKSVMQELGGFKTNFWPGEDTKLCLDITKGIGKKIIYDPSVRVYHHRRPLFMSHIKQVANYALHRGYFTKKYSETSLRLPYFIPTLFLFVLIIGAILSLTLAPLRIIYFLGLSLYLISVLISSIHKELRLIPLVAFGIVSTHLTYGSYFLKGLISRKLKEEL